MENLQLPKKSNFKRKAVALAIILVYTVSIMTILLSPSPVYGLDQTTVYGTVNDENGAALSSATVSLYGSGGGIIATTLTGSDGNFAVANVAFGTYSLHISNVGYVETVRNITVNTSGQQLGTFVLSPALKLSASLLEMIVSPGDKIAFPFTVRNSGTATEVVTFSISVPENWSVSVSNGNNKVIKVSLSSGQSISLQLDVTVASTAVGDTSYSISIAAHGTTTASLNFTVLTSPTGFVSGKIVDEDGDQLSNIQIDAYSPKGLLIENVTTVSYGDFTVELPIAVSSLQFLKLGYKNVTKAVSLTDGATADLGSVVLTNGAILSSSVSNIVASPGEKLGVPFVLSNVGITETVELSASYPDGWSAKVLNSNSREITNVTLSSGTTSNYQLEATVSPAATGEYSLTVTVDDGVTTSELSFTITIGSTGSSVLSCQLIGKYATPGDSVKFQVALKNPFSVAMRFKVSVDSIPSNWTASVKTASGDSFTEIILAAGESVNLVVQVDSFASAVTGESYGLTVNAVSSEYNASYSLPITVTLAEASNEVTLTASLPEIGITAGNTASYSVTIVNLGVTDRLLSLFAQIPSGWTAVFKLGSTVVTTLNLYSGNMSALTIVITPPSSVNVGSYKIPVQVLSETGAVLDELNLTTTITGSYDMTLTLSTYLTSTTSGGTATFTATITNSGYSTLTGVVVDITLPEDTWDYTVTPAQVDTLGTKESASFTVTVTTTETTVSGDYMVTVTGSSDQVSSDSSQVRVTLETSTSWGIYGVVIAVVFIVLLIVVFRKFKRR